MEDKYIDRIINDALRTRGYYPLRPMQLWMVDSQFYKIHSTMLNQGALYKLAPEIDLNRFAQAMNDTLNNYDVFRCRMVFHPETDDICQRFDGEIVPVTVEKISDEELEQRKKTLMRPYELINKPLYRLYIFETPTAKYFYFDFYHTIMDGTSIMVLFVGEVNSRYKGKKITRVPLNYADYILEDMKVSTEEFEAGSKHWMSVLNKIELEKHFLPMDLINMNEIEAKSEFLDWRQGCTIIPVKNVTREYFLKSKRKDHIFFFAATMLAIAKSTGSKNAIMDWIHNGRYDAQERRLMGAMLEQFPICCEFEDGMTIDDLLDNLEKELTDSVKYRKSLSVAYNSGKDVCSTFVFQKKIRSTMRNLTVCGYPAEAIELPPNEWSVTENSLDVQVNFNDDDTYDIEYSYDSGLYSEDAIKKFAASIDEIILQLCEDKVLVSEILK